MNNVLVEWNCNALKATYEPQGYYDDREAKVSAIEEAIERLRS